MVYIVPTGLLDNLDQNYSIDILSLVGQKNIENFDTAIIP